MDIKDIRKQSGLARVAFSKKYGIPIRTIEDWESGKRKPPEYVLRLLGDAVSADTMKNEPAELTLIDRLDLGGGFYSEKYTSDDYDVSVLSSGGSVTINASPMKSWLPEIRMNDGEVTRIGFVGDIVLEDNIADCANGLMGSAKMIEMLRESFF